MLLRFPVGEGGISFATFTGACARPKEAGGRDPREAGGGILRPKGFRRKLGGLVEVLRGELGRLEVFGAALGFVSFSRDLWELRDRKD